MNFEPQTVKFDAQRFKFDPLRLKFDPQRVKIDPQRLNFCERLTKNRGFVERLRAERFFKFQLQSLCRHGLADLPLFFGQAEQLDDAGGVGPGFFVGAVEDDARFFCGHGGGLRQIEVLQDI